MRTSATIAAKREELDQADKAASVYLAAGAAKKAGVPTRRIAILALLGCGVSATQIDALTAANDQRV